MAGKILSISVISYFYIAVVLDGLQRLAGLFVVELLKSVSVTRQNAVAPFIYSWAVAHIMASFSDILIETKYSEYFIFFGVLLSATGAALCILATNISTIIVFWGFIFGSGYGLTYPHLSRRLKSVNSSKSSFILQVTPSLGVSIMPFVLSLLNSHYGLQGSYLIFSGIILHYLPLAVAAAYNIEICIPNIKWRVRKKSSHYFVSKQEGGKAVSIESFINSLEPDLILKINESDECQYELNGDISEVSTKDVFSIGRKRSETRGNDLQGLEIDTRQFPRHRTLSQMVSQIKNIEKGKTFCEGSFSNKDIIPDVVEHKEFKSCSNVNCDVPHRDKILEKNILNTTKNDLNLKYEILHKICECEINETAGENQELENNGHKNYTVDNISDLAHTSVLLENAITDILSENQGNNTCQTDESHENEKRISFRSEYEQDKSLSSQKFESIKPLDNETTKLSRHSLENKPVFNIPLDIKVHVEEYIFSTDQEHWSESFSINYLKDSYRNHSNSILSDMHENNHSASQTLPKKFLTCSDLLKPKLSNIYSISENTELHDKRISGEKNNKKKQQNESGNQAKIKFVKFFKLLNEIASPVCLCIILITIIFEINLVTLLTMFGDFGNDVASECSDFKWILVAFGAGGFVGKFCCCKISRTIPEKSHAIGVVLFLLTGLSTAGILYSPSLNWLAGFYCILGALEGGITYTVPKLILEYTHKDIHPTLFSVKSFLSGVAIICIPYVIGLFPNELGDYEFLLQTLSCSSVLCALLAYFLPYLRSESHKQITPSFRSKMEVV